MTVQTATQFHMRGNPIMGRFLLFFIFIFICNFVYHTSAHGLNEQCYIDGSVENFGVLTLNMSFCGGPISDYLQTFESKDSDGDGILSFSEFSTGCFDPYVFKLFCLADRNEDGQIDLGELVNYTRLEDSFIYFGNPSNNPPPESISADYMNNLLNSIGISPSDPVFEGLIDPDSMTVNTVAFIEALHNGTVDPEKVYCAQGFDCSILFLPISELLGKADTDANGVLNVHEFSTSDMVEKWRTMVLPPYDYNKDGKIQLEEWKTYLATYVQSELEKLNQTAEDMGNSTESAMVTIEGVPTEIAPNNTDATGDITTVALVMKDYLLTTRSLQTDMNLMENPTTVAVVTEAGNNPTTRNLQTDANPTEKMTTVAMVTEAENNPTTRSLQTDMNPMENPTTVAPMTETENNPPTTKYPQILFIFTPKPVTVAPVTEAEKLTTRNPQTDMNPTEKLTTEAENNPTTRNLQTDANLIRDTTTEAAVVQTENNPTTRSLQTDVNPMENPTTVALVTEAENIPTTTRSLQTDVNPTEKMTTVATMTEAGNNPTTTRSLQTDMNSMENPTTVATMTEAGNNPTTTRSLQTDMNSMENPTTVALVTEGENNPPTTKYPMILFIFTPKPVTVAPVTEAENKLTTGNSQTDMNPTEKMTTVAIMTEAENNPTTKDLQTDVNPIGNPTTVAMVTDAENNPTTTRSLQTDVNPTEKMTTVAIMTEAGNNPTTRSLQTDMNPMENPTTIALVTEEGNLLTTKNLQTDVNPTEKLTTVAMVTEAENNPTTTRSLQTDVNPTEKMTTVATMTEAGNNSITTESSLTSVSSSPKCTGAEKNETFMLIVFDLMFCGGPVLDYMKTFDSKDLDFDISLSPSEFENGCFQPFVDKLFCMADVNEDSVIDADEFTDFIISQDEFKYFSNADNTSPPEFLSKKNFKILLERHGINSTNPNLTALVDPDGNIAVSNFYKIIHSMPEMFQCNVGLDCDIFSGTFSEILNSYDSNNDSVVTYDEFKHSSTIQSYRTMVFVSYDYDRNDKIELSEWVTYLSGYVQMANFSNIFQNFDSNKDGIWNKHELIKYLKSRNIERRHAWEVFQDYDGLTLNIAYQFVSTLPNSKFRYFEDSVPDNTDSNSVTNKPNSVVNSTV